MSQDLKWLVAAWIIVVGMKWFLVNSQNCTLHRHKAGLIKKNKKT